MILVDGRAVDDPLLSEARAWLRARIDDGARCPCCTQLAKVYRRRVNAQMAITLIAMHRAHELDEWINLPALVGEHRADEAKMSYWELIEEDGETRPDGSTRTGWWRITTRGRNFVQGVIKIPKYARVYDGRCLGFIGDPVSIRDALGAKFDYDKLMRGEA